MMTFEEEILQLISMKQEGGYWDFKKQWHEKKTNLLHDLICMANNLHNRDAYIIIGVDEECDFAVVDVKDDANRRNTQKMVDFLKDKKFIGGIRPLVRVEQLSLFEGTIDVIVIENSNNTPFYLTESFEGVRANSIYTRVMDTNTPIDKSADINNVEYLWRKRFHLDQMPIDKFSHFLKNPDDWEDIQDHDMGYFYKYAPEYTITCEKDDRNGYEYYIFGQVNSTPSWWIVTLKYHQTAIARFLGLALDGGRSFVVAPERTCDLLHSHTSSVGYYIQDELGHRLLRFYHRKETSDEYSYEAYMRAILIFKSQYEYKKFTQYVKNNMQRYHQLRSTRGNSDLPSFPKLGGYDMNSFVQEYRDALVLKEMLKEYRKEVW